MYSLRLFVGLVGFFFYNLSFFCTGFLPVYFLYTVGNLVYILLLVIFALFL